MKDLVVLVADKCMEHVLEGLLERPHSLGIRPITHDVLIHPRRDPGCFNEAHHFLRPFSHKYAYALVMFDHEGCGREHQPSDVVANEVKLRLEQNGWSGRADAVVLSPELEVWVWSDSPHVPACLGWAERHPSLRQWLAANSYWPSNAHKPPRPKEAMEAALRYVRKPYSAAIYLELATKVPLQGHSEPAFLRFTGALQRWFG
ncbi:MAG: hypothetical protein N2383_12160 [Caldilineales bacterium]|nr:hypothetical protein [Caldilineales bacterium]